MENFGFFSYSAVNDVQNHCLMNTFRLCSVLAIFVCFKSFFYFINAVEYLAPVDKWTVLQLGNDLASSSNAYINWQLLTKSPDRNGHHGLFFWCCFLLRFNFVHFIISVFFAITLSQFDFNARLQIKKQPATVFKDSTIVLYYLYSQYEMTPDLFWHAFTLDRTTNNNKRTTQQQLGKYSKIQLLQNKSTLSNILLYN